MTKMSAVLKAEDYIRMSAEARVITKELRSQGLDFSIYHQTGDDPEVLFRFEGKTHEIPFVLGDGDVDDALKRTRETLDALTAPRSGYPKPPSLDPTKQCLVKTTNGYKLRHGQNKKNVGYLRERRDWLCKMRELGADYATIHKMLRATGADVKLCSIDSMVFRALQGKGEDRSKPVITTKPAYAPNTKLSVGAVPVPKPSPTVSEAEIVIPQSVQDRVDEALKKLIDKRLTVLLGEQS